MLREKSYGIKDKSDTTGKDLLTLLVRANLQDVDGMSDSDVRARKGPPTFPPFLLTTRIPSRDLHLPCCRPRDDERRHVVDLVRAVSKPRGTEKTPGRTFGSLYGRSDDGPAQGPPLLGHGRS